MSDRTNVTISIVALVAAVATLPASVALVKDSARDRASIAVLQTPSRYNLRDSRILDPELYSNDAVPADGGGLTLLSVVVNSAQLGATADVWNTLKDTALANRARMTAAVALVGHELPPHRAGSNLTVLHVEDSEAYAVRTGIRVAPFTLIITEAGHVLVAGPGLPTHELVADATRRFLESGPATPTIFHTASSSVVATLVSLEAPSTSTAIEP